MQITKSLLALALGAMVLAGSAALAGPFAEFEEQMRAAYAPYRNALFQTNKKDKAASEQALKKFSSDWTALSARWSKEPPPQYVDDVEFASTLAAVTSVAEKGHAAISKGDLADAHEILEKIRDLLGGLRSRNGIVTFSDRMNAYHEAMEHILTKPYGGYDAKGLGELREGASVLAYLFGQLETHRPAHTVGIAEFGHALSGVKASVENLLAAARTGDPVATRQAVQKLKQPYSLLFLKFG
ncbi:MAG: hypothetical protein ACRET6_01445 [Burkholderiales bacterium]